MGVSNFCFSGDDIQQILIRFLDIYLRLFRTYVDTFVERVLCFSWNQLGLHRFTQHLIVIDSWKLRWRQDKIKNISKLLYLSTY